MPSSKISRHNEPPLDHIMSCLSKLRAATTSLDAMSSRSPITIPTSPSKHFETWVSALYNHKSLLWLVGGHKPSADEKDRPIGKSVTVAASRTDDYVKEGAPDAIFTGNGGFVCANPVSTTKGSGKQNRHCDQDVAEFRYTLLEHDGLDVAHQAALLSALRLPVVSIVHSGGRSLHALVRIDAPSWEAYDEVTTRLHRILTPFGFDPTNRNLSRLTRAPGATRTLLDGSTVLQRLVWLNPDASSVAISDILKQNKQ